MVESFFSINKLRPLWSCLLFLISSALFASQEPQGESPVTQEPQIHALIMIKPLGPNMQKAVLLDQKNMEAFLNEVSQATKYKLHLTIMQASQPMVPTIERWLKSLPKSQNDIVVFYYSGHGAKAQEENKWPILGNERGLKNRIAGDAIVSFLEQQPYRLSLVLFDCCNKTKARGNYCRYLAKGGLQFDPEVLKNLFMNDRGLMIGAGARRGESSWFDTGSFFTNKILKFIAQADPKDSWVEIFKKVAAHFDHTPANHAQHPSFEIWRWDMGQDGVANRHSGNSLC